MQTIRQTLRQFVSENFLFGQAIALSDEDSFLAKGIIDSTGVLELITFLEEHYHIKVEDEELIEDNLDSIQNVVGFLTRKLNGNKENELAGGIVSGVER